MSKWKLAKEVAISLIYLGKYLIKKRKEKQQDKKVVDDGIGFG